MIFDQIIRTIQHIAITEHDLLMLATGMIVGMMVRSGLPGRAYRTVRRSRRAVEPF